MAGDYAQTVAASIVKQLEDGTAPWVKPWEPSGLRFIPYNATTGKDYQGGNAIWLMAVAEMKGYSDPRWTTYKQAQSLDAQVMKGEKGTLIQYFKKFDRVPVKDEQGRPVKDAEGNPIYRSVELERPRVFSAVVFNAEQIAGMPKIEARPALAEWERHAAAEQIMTHSGVPIIYRPGDRAFYAVAQDRVTMPERDQFKTADRFYSTALHELGHNAVIRIMPHIAEKARLAASSCQAHSRHNLRRSNNMEHEEHARRSGNLRRSVPGLVRRKPHRRRLQGGYHHELPVDHQEARPSDGRGRDRAFRFDARSGRTTGTDSAAQAWPDRPPA